MPSKRPFVGSEPQGCTLLRQLPRSKGLPRRRKTYHQNKVDPWTARVSLTVSCTWSMVHGTDRRAFATNRKVGHGDGEVPAGIPQPQQGW